MKTRITLGIVVHLLVACSLVAAQTTTATLTGVARDESGGVLPGVTLVVKSTDTGQTRELVTDDQGRYIASQLAPGNYEVEASLAGFQTAVRTGLTLTVGQNAVVDMDLKVGAISERLIVSGQAPLVETTSSALTGVIDQKQVMDLPLNQRNFIQLATLEPGVIWQRNVSSRGSGNLGYGMKVVVAGSRPTGNNFLLDGTDINEPHGRTPGSATGSTLGVEAVREFQILTRNYSSEFGRATGGVVNIVTKSGTNAFHGSTFYFHRNSAWDARNFFDRGAKPDFTRHQGGVAVGGPIVADRTFFFGSYEGLKETLGITTISTVPSLNGRRGLLPQGQIAIKPEVLPFLNAFPLPNGRDFGDGRAEFLDVFSQKSTEGYYSARVDHTFTDSLSGFVRYTFDRSTVYGYGSNYNTIPQQVANDDTSRKQYVTGEVRKILSPSLIYLGRVGYNETAYKADEVYLDDLSSLILDRSVNRPASIAISGFARLGSSNLHPQRYPLQVYDIQNSISRETTSHAFKAGFQFMHMRQNSFFPSRSVGVWSFNTLSDFLVGSSSNVQAAPPAIADPQKKFRQNLYGLYVQDDWRVQQNLTLNLGLRYEPTSVISEVDGKMSQIDRALLLNYTGSARDIRTTGDNYKNPDKMAFAPRVGIAWDPFGEGRTAIRSGVGLFYDHVYIRWLGSFLASRTPPSYNIIDERIVPFPQTASELIARYSTVGKSAAFIDSEPTRQYMWHWNTSVQQEIGNQIAVTAAYVGSRGVDLGRLTSANEAVPVGMFDDRRPLFSATPALPNPNWTSITFLTTDASSHYHGLELGLQKRGVDFQYRVSYTFSKAVDTSTGVRTANDEANSPTSIHLLFPDYDEALSAYHVPHNFSTNVSYTLPGRNLTGIAGQLVGGWQVNAIFTMAAGSYFTVTQGTNNVTALLGGRRPDLVAGAEDNPVLGGPDRYFDPSSSFVPSNPRTFGTLGRNTVSGPGVSTFDLSFVKDTALASGSPEGPRMQFRFEMFNLLNTANFAQPASQVFDGAGRPVGTAGRITDTTTTSRQLQAAVKFLF